MSATEQTIESSGVGGLTNPVCEIKMQKTFNPNTLGVPFNFSKVNCSASIDVITAGITEIKSDAANGWIYNSAVEFSTALLSPLNTEWNSVFTDAVNNGHANIQNVATRTYSDFNNALNNSIDANVLITPLVMHDLITDKYYLFTFTTWQSNSGISEAYGTLDITTYPPADGTIVTLASRTYTYDLTLDLWTNIDAGSFTDLNDCISNDPFAEVLTDYGNPLIGVFPIAILGVCGNSLVTSVSPVQAGFEFFDPTLTNGIGGGGSFAYTRTEVQIGTILCSGKIIFDDNTFLDTAPVFESLVPTHAAKSPTTTYAAPISTGVNSVLIGLGLNDGGGSEVFALGTRLVLNGSPTLFGVIALGFANRFNAGNYTGIYFIGDGNTFNGGSSYATIIGEQNSITGGTYSVIQGISNTHNSANSQVTIGFANSILNSSQSVVIGHSNGLSSLNSSVIIGRNNTSVISASSVNVLNANFGLKVLATFSGIGTIGFVPTARWHVKGIGNTSATTGLLVESSNTQNFFRVYDDGSIVSVGAANNAHSFSTYVGSVSLSFNSPVSQYLEFRVTGNIKSQLINQNGLTRFNQAVGQFWGVYGSDNNPYILFDETNKNVGFGLLAPTARVHIKGINVSPLNYTLKIENSVSNLYKISNNGEHTFNSYFNGGGSGVPNFLFQSNDSLLLKLTSSAGSIISWDEASGNTGQFSNTGGYAQMLFKNRFTLKRYSDNVSKLWMDDANGYIGIGYVYFAANAQLDVYGDTTLTNYAFHIGGGVSADLFKVRNDGRISMNQLPTSNVGLVAGELWNNAGVVNIV